MSFTLRNSRRALLPALLGLTVILGGCSDDEGGNGGGGPSQARAYNQVQRLGNPLVSEVLLAKRSHPTHGSTGPADDATLIAAEALAFLTGPGSVANRSSGYATVLGGALIPDMLIVQTDKDPANSGWLTWLPLAPFTNGYGGRKLSDDVVDLALLAVFGDPFGADPGTVTPSLTTDNVANDSQFLTAFPYVGNPN
jgi:Domain of unknown function (DUF4331)